jgi:hypothetical protein
MYRTDVLPTSDDLVTHALLLQEGKDRVQIFDDDDRDNGISKHVREDYHQ